MPDLRASIDAQAKKLVAESLSEIPDGKRGALLVIADEHGARAHVAARINGDWKVSMAAGREWDGEVTGQVAVVGSW